MHHTLKHYPLWLLWQLPNNDKGGHNSTEMWHHHRVASRRTVSVSSRSGMSATVNISGCS